MPSFGFARCRYSDLHYLYSRHILGRDSGPRINGRDADYNNDFDLLVNGATFKFTEANGWVMTGPPENLRREAAYIAKYGM